MSRLRSLTPDEFDPELRALLDADHKSERELRPMSIRAHHPELAKAYARYSTASRQCAVLSPRLRELVRLRIAFHNQCRSCMAMRYSDAVDAGVTEDLVCSLEQPHEAPDLSPAERLALRYADLLATNHLAIDDAFYERLKQHFSEKELVELGSWCAICVGFGRLSATWDMTEDLAPRFRADSADPVTPWGPDAWVTGSAAKAS
jgi:AhpD family alkylhydroperoxidase